MDFPFLGGAEIGASIQVWVRMELNDGGGDIVVLGLMTDPVLATWVICSQNQSGIQTRR